MPVKLSLCVPTYNRARYLANCLQSIISNTARSQLDFEVCVSDNGSTDGTEEIVGRAQSSIPIKYQKNARNLGLPRNFLNVVAMAGGDFVWLIGDDDLLLPYALQELLNLISEHPAVDFFYINSFHLTAEHVLSFPQPFDTLNLPDDMTPFSSWPRTGELKFMDLINPRVSFDFLGGMFLSVFRRRKWIANAVVLDEAAIADQRTFSHFDNTFPHVKIFAKAFAGSRAFFSARPLSVCLTGAREWAPMYSLVKSVRLVEALDEYRKNGLPFVSYWHCKNHALDNAVPDLVSMFVRRDRSGFGYVNPRLILGYFLYPRFYLSVIKFVLRKTARLVERIGKGRRRHAE